MIFFIVNNIIYMFIYILNLYILLYISIIYKFTNKFQE